MKHKTTIILIVLMTILLFPSSSITSQTAKKIMLKNTAVFSNTHDNKQIPVLLKNDDYVLFGKYLDEPILWKVLDISKNGQVLLMTEYIICLKSFDSCGNDDNYHIGKDIEKYGSSDWVNSSLRQWLNSTEQAVTYSHCPPNADNTYKGYNAYNEESGFLCSNNFNAGLLEIISDQGVFLLTKAALSNYFTAAERAKTCTKSAILHNNAPYIITTSKKIWYWASSPVSSNNVSVTAVTSSGGFYKSLAYDGIMGVSPALYLSSTLIQTSEGCGSKTDPYRIS